MWRQMVVFQHFKDIPAIEKVITIVPSSRASSIEVHYTRPGETKSIKLKNEDEMTCVAGEMVTGLSMHDLDLQTYSSA